MPLRPVERGEGGKFSRAPRRLGADTVHYIMCFLHAVYRYTDYGKEADTLPILYIHL